MKKIFIIILVLPLFLTSCSIVNDINSIIKPKLSDIDNNTICNELEKNPLNDDKYIGKYIKITGKSKIFKDDMYNRARLVLYPNKGIVQVDGYPNLKSIENNKYYTVTGRVSRVSSGTLNNNCHIDIEYYKF